MFSDLDLDCSLRLLFICTLLAKPAIIAYRLIAVPGGARRY